MINAYLVIGSIHTLGMLQFVKRFEHDTAAWITIADGIQPFLHVGHSVDQPRFGTLAKDLFGFLPCYFPAQTVFDYVVALPAKMEADFSRIFTVGRVRINVFSMLARTDGDGKVVLLVQYFHYLFIG
jgi:hypothetical protein